MIKTTKKVRIAVVFLLIAVAIQYFDLFSRYNALTAYFDLYSGKAIYPQCEYNTSELRDINSSSDELGYKIVHVDCDLFYTKGMDNYYSIMIRKIEEHNGQNWHEDLYKRIKH